MNLTFSELSVGSPVSGYDPTKKAKVANGIGDYQVLPKPSSLHANFTEALVEPIKDPMKQPSPEPEGR